MNWPKPSCSDPWPPRRTRRTCSEPKHPLRWLAVCPAGGRFVIGIGSTSRGGLNDPLWSTSRSTKIKLEHAPLQVDPLVGNEPSVTDTGLGTIGLAVTGQQPFFAALSFNRIKIIAPLFVFERLTVPIGGAFFNHLSNPDGSLAMPNEGPSLDSCLGHSAPIMGGGTGSRKILLSWFGDPCKGGAPGGAGGPSGGGPPGAGGPPGGGPPGGGAPGGFAHNSLVDINLFKLWDDIVKAARLGAVSRGRPMRRTCPTVGSTTITATSTAPMPGSFLFCVFLTWNFLSLFLLWRSWNCQHRAASGANDPDMCVLLGYYL